jgi:hypothetical protein
MNSNLFQTILTVLLTISSIGTMILLNMGCLETPAGSLSCAAATAPAWLMPYLAMIATGLGFLKLVIAFFQGKLIAPTKVVK